MLARKKDYNDPAFKLVLDVEFVEKYPLTGGAIFAIVFFTFVALILIAIGTALVLNRYGVIELYLPKKFRVLCLKKIDFKEQDEAVEHEEEMKKKVAENQALKYR